MKFPFTEINNHPYHIHTMAVEMIEKGSKVLDIGCATGYIDRELKKKGCEVWGTDGFEGAVKKAKKYCKEAIVCDFEKVKSLPFPKKYFNYIIILDVIEHLCFPEHILKAIKPHLKKGGKILISVPNVAHAEMRWTLLTGQFDYVDEGGILQSTHYHFYNLKTFKEALINNGFKVIDVLPTNGMTRVPLLGKFTDRIPPYWQYQIAKLIPTLFSYQFMAMVDIAK